MTRDTMTGGDWAICAVYLAIYLAAMTWLIITGRRETSRAADDIISRAAADVIAEAEQIARQAAP